MGFFSKPQANPPPAHTSVPQHIAIIMDGNGRWAKQRFMPRVAGHKKGVEVVREVVRSCAQGGVKFLTLFAFSSENWRRPEEEVSFLMGLFKIALGREVEELHRNGIRLMVAGDLSALPDEIRAAVNDAQTMTANNDVFTLTLCVNYGGRWDVTQAVNRVLQTSPAQISAEDIERNLALAYAPEPDLFIRTGGEKRISNFLLWQLAYTELFFTDILWPDFDTTALDAAIASYGSRERRFGQTSEQVAAQRA